MKRKAFTLIELLVVVAIIGILAAVEVLFEVEPRFFKNIKGTHTYNFNKGLLVFDYVEVTNHH